MFFYSVCLKNEMPLLPLLEINILRGFILIIRVDDLADSTDPVGRGKGNAEIENCRIVRCSPKTASRCRKIIFGAVMKIGHYEGLAGAGQFLLIIGITALRDIVKLFAVREPQDGIAVKLFLINEIQPAVGMGENLREACKIVAVAELPFMNHTFVG